MAEGGRSVVIPGSRPKLEEPRATAIQQQWPTLRVAGHLTPLRADLPDRAAPRRIQADLAARRPDPLVVAMGKPLQEWWMSEYERKTVARVAPATPARRTAL